MRLDGVIQPITNRPCRTGSTWVGRLSPADWVNKTMQKGRLNRTDIRIRAKRHGHQLADENTI